MTRTTHVRRRVLSAAHAAPGVRPHAGLRVLSTAHAAPGVRTHAGLRVLSAAHAAPGVRTHAGLRGRKRRGVTLVEMLVATAMCILGMWMLTWMFQQATASFSLANAQVALTGQERMVTTVMTRDMSLDMFTDEGRRKLSDQRLDLLHDTGYTPPQSGYFWASSAPAGSPENPSEPADSNGFSSSRSANHAIGFTAILPDTPGNRFLAQVPAGSTTTHAGTAAEISYYLVPNGQTPGGVRLYDLLRVQRLAALSTDDARDYQNTAVNPNPTDAVDEVMTVFGGQMRNLNDLSIPLGFPNSPRFAMPATPLAARTARASTSARYGEDRLMSNVLSFEIKFTGTAGRGSGIPWPTPFASGNTDYPYDTLPYNHQFDTFSTRVANWNDPNNKAPTNASGGMKPIRITGAQIRIRALNGTNTRQTTFTVSF